VLSVGSVVIKIFEINMNLGFIKPQSPQRTQRGCEKIGRVEKKIKFDALTLYLKRYISFNGRDFANFFTASENTERMVQPLRFNSTPYFWVQLNLRDLGRRTVTLSTSDHAYPY